MSNDGNEDRGFLRSLSWRGVAHAVIFSRAARWKDGSIKAWQPERETS